MVHSSARFGDEYDRDFQASERKGLQAFSASVGSYQTVPGMCVKIFKSLSQCFVHYGLPSFTIYIVLFGNRANIVDGGDGDVSIKTHERGR